jgi:hypothetical protein
MPGNQAHPAIHGIGQTGDNRIGHRVRSENLRDALSAALVRIGQVVLTQEKLAQPEHSS